MLRPALALLGSVAIVVAHGGDASAGDLLPAPGTSALCGTSDAKPTAGYTAAIQGDCEITQDGVASPARKAQSIASSPPAYSCSFTSVPNPNVAGGGYMVKNCVGDGNAATPDQPLPVPFLVPLDDSSSAPTAKSLALSELRNLHLAPPMLRLSPGLDQPQVVNADAWYWLDPASWRPVTATVSNAGLTVTLTATPTLATWTSGDGGSVNCAGAGTPYPVGDPNPPAQSPTCGHAFTRASDGFPGGVYPLTARESWQINWQASNGESGTFPSMTTSSTAQVRVVEVQALVTGVRT
ncbi:hypothetical protein ABIA31_002905 [Catenulispora sp. MAP5-51]